MSLMTNGPQSSVKTYEVSLFAPSQSELFDRKLKINLSFIALSVVSVPIREYDRWPHVSVN